MKNNSYWSINIFYATKPEFYNWSKKRFVSLIFNFSPNVFFIHLILNFCMYIFISVYLLDFIVFEICIN
jgi:hypothetical protein